MGTININDFVKVEMRVGLVLEAAAVDGSDKLIREVVDFGLVTHEIKESETQPQRDIRVIYSGLRKWYSPDELVGRKFVFVVNLEPRPMMGEESQGMIMVVEVPGGKPVLLVPAEEIAVGARVR